MGPRRRLPDPGPGRLGERSALCILAAKSMQGQCFRGNAAWAWPWSLGAARGSSEAPVEDKLEGVANRSTK